MKEQSKQKIANLIEQYKKIVGEDRINSYNEANTRKNFILPFFEALGWDVYSEDIREEEKASKGRVDYAFCLNKIPKFFLEAKSLKVDLNEPQWAEQAVNYAWHKGVTWAILTDFEGIKVFNAEWKLKSQMPVFEWTWEEYIEKFEEIWWLSKESFENNILLEQAKKKWKSIIAKSPVGKQLYDDMMDWREKLTKSIKAKRQEVKLDEELIDECVQRILDRLIFIRTCEDREIEPATLKAKMREWEFNRGDRKLMHVLSGIFRDFDDGYNSNIFKEHLCEKLNIDDDVLYEIIKGLYETKDYSIKYDFSAIDSDVLGGIYEQYLGHILKKERVVKKHQHRKEQGIYYTPTYIVDYIVKNTLGEILKTKSYNEIAKLKILDPACGSGSFLIKAFEVMDNYLKEARSSKGVDMDYLRRFEILSGNIYGVDLDKQAVEIVRLNLALKTLTTREKLPMLKNIRQGNSLISGSEEELKKYFGADWQEKHPFNWEQEYRDVIKNGGFDVIIGNPPYIFARGGNFSEDSKKYFCENFSLANYQLNTYLLFIDRAIKLLKTGGHFGFIIPNTWLTIDTFSVLRKFLLEQTADLQIINIYDKVFQDANVDTCLLLFRKGKSNQITLGEFKEGALEITGKFPASSFIVNNFIINIALVKNKGKSAILDIIGNHSKPLSEFAIVSTGLKAYQEGKGNPLQTREIKENRVFHSDNKKNDSYKKYLNGRDVCRYFLGWSGEYLSYGDWLAEPRKSVPFIGKRILIRQIPSSPPYSINAIFTEKEFLNDINSMVVFDFKCSPLYLLAVLNSRITTFWFVNTFDKFQRKTFPQFKVKELAIFPIPSASKEEQNKLADMAQNMLTLHKELQASAENTEKYDKLKRQIELLDQEIDLEVYKLYNLTEEEVKIVEK